MPGATNSKGASDSSVVGADGKSAKPEQYSAHSACVLEINKKAGEVPRYGNTTSETASSQSGDHQKQSHDKGAYFDEHMLCMCGLHIFKNTQIKNICHS